MTLNKLIEELQKLSQHAGDKTVEVETENAGVTLELSGDFIIDGDVVVIGTNSPEDSE